jgi:hypothetical protein
MDAADVAVEPPKGFDAAGVDEVGPNGLAAADFVPKIDCETGAGFGSSDAGLSAVFSAGFSASFAGVGGSNVIEGPVAEAGAAGSGASEAAPNRAAVLGVKRDELG